jgi:lipocalin
MTRSGRAGATTDLNQWSIGRKYLWLLARMPTIPEPRYSARVAKADQLGFDTSRLLKDPQR